MTKISEQEIEEVKRLVKKSIDHDHRGLLESEIEYLEKVQTKNYDEYAKIVESCYKRDVWIQELPKIQNIKL